MNSESPVRVRLWTSRRLAMLMVLLYGGALLLLMFFAVAWWWKAAIAVAIAASCGLNWRQHVMLRGRRAVTEIRWNGSDWRLTTAVGQDIAASLLGTTFVHHWLVVLNFKVVGQRGMWPVLIFPDGADPDDFRRLTVRVRRMLSVRGRA